VKVVPFLAETHTGTIALKAYQSRAATFARLRKLFFIIAFLDD
jgi:hypothetical protein